MFWLFDHRPGIVFIVARFANALCVIVTHKHQKHIFPIGSLI